MYQAEEITGCLRAVFVLAPNPTRNWTQSTKIQADTVNFFQGFTLIKFKSTLKNTLVFFQPVFKNYFVMKSLKPF